MTEAQELTAEQALQQAREAQTTFWEAVATLERILRTEVDSNQDLEVQTVESLLACE